MRHLFVIVISLSLFSTPLFSAEPDKKLHLKCLYPTVMVQAKNLSSTGTGFIVKSEKISENLYHNVAITCGHVVSQNQDYIIKIAIYKDWSDFTGYKEYPSLIYISTIEKDIAIVLFATKEKVPTVELDFNSKLYIGTDVFRIGHGLGDQSRIDYGKVTSTKSSVGKLFKNVIRFSIYTVPGDSGAPIFYNYKVIAFAQGIRAYIRGWNQEILYGVSYGVPISRVKLWNAELNNSISFVYEDKDIPVLSFVKLKLKGLEIED